MGTFAQMLKAYKLARILSRPFFSMVRFCIVFPCFSSPFLTVQKWMDQAQSAAGHRRCLAEVAELHRLLLQVPQAGEAGSGEKWYTATQE